MKEIYNFQGVCKEVRPDDTEKRFKDIFSQKRINFL